MEKLLEPKLVKIEVLEDGVLLIVEITESESAIVVGDGSTYGGHAAIAL